MDKLLPCPFCGGEAKLIQREFKYGFYPSGGTYYVHCKSCLITTQPRRKSEYVVAVWNRRAILDGCENGLIVRCESCKHYNRIGCSDGFGWCENMDMGVSDDFYCANGAKMEVET